MSRQVFMTFFGEEKWRSLPTSEEVAAEPHADVEHEESTPGITGC